MSDERPRERLARLGPESLSDLELVMLVLRSGARARSLPTLAGELLGARSLATALLGESLASLARRPGLGPAKAASLVAAVELGRRALAPPLEPGLRITSPMRLESHFRARFRGASREAFHVLALDARNRLLGEDCSSVGTLSASLVHPREVFREAIRRGAAAIVVLHNHPSGDATPSPEDRQVTRRLREAGAVVGIELLDHLIVGARGAFSFRESEPSLWEPLPPSRRREAKGCR